LNDYSVLARYPGSWEILEKDKSEALKFAASILGTVRGLIR